jgi:CO/xanthine dehydrogenase Mo-binding subunit
MLNSRSNKSSFPLGGFALPAIYRLYLQGNSGKGTLDPKAGQGSPYFVYSYSTYMAEGIVDRETGNVEVTDYTGAYDIGKAINPRLVEGQIEGEIWMGVGCALMEEIIVKEGIIQNLGLEDFRFRRSWICRQLPPSLSSMKIDRALTG